MSRGFWYYWFELELSQQSSSSLSRAYPVPIPCLSRALGWVRHGIGICDAYVTNPGLLMIAISGGRKISRKRFQSDTLSFPNLLLHK